MLRFMKTATSTVITQSPNQLVVVKLLALKSKRGASYRTLYQLLATTRSMSEQMSELAKLGSVLVLIALSNAISERGFSLMEPRQDEEEGAAEEPDARPKVPRRVPRPQTR